MLRRETLSRAGKAFDGLEDLLGGGRSGTFDLQVSYRTALMKIRFCITREGRAAFRKILCISRLFRTLLLLSVCPESARSQPVARGMVIAGHCSPA